MDEKDNGQTPVMNGLACLLFGVKDTTWGWCNSSELAEASQKLELMRGDGGIVGTVHHGHKKTFTATYVPFASGTGAPISAIAEFGSGKKMTFLTPNGSPIECIIDNIAITSNQGQAMTYKIDGTYYPLINSAGGTP